jgi:hypothetical protein
MGCCGSGRGSRGRGKGRSRRIKQGGVALAKGVIRAKKIKELKEKEKK